MFHVSCFPHIFHPPWLPYMVKSSNCGGPHHDIFSSQLLSLPRRPKYSPQIPFFRHLHLPLFFQSDRPVHTHTVQQISGIRFYEWDSKTNWIAARLPISSLNKFPLPLYLIEPKYPSPCQQELGHLLLSWARRIQFTPSHNISLRSILYYPLMYA